MTPTCRGFFYCKFDSCTKFDAHRYDSFTQRFPAAYFYLDRIDYFGLKRENAKRPLPSLTAVNLRHAIKHLSDIHKRYLSDPERIPRYRASSSVLLPWSPGSAFSDTSDSTANYAFMNQGYGNEEDFSTTTGFGFGNQFYETMGPNTAFFATSEFDIGTGMMDSLEPLQPIDSDNQFMFTPDGDDFLLAPDGAVEIEAPQFFTDLPPPPEEEKKVEPPAPEPQNNFGAPFESLEPLQPLEPLELTPMEPLQPLDQMGLAPLEPLDPMPFNPDLVPLEPLQPLQSLDPPTSTVNVNQTTVTTTTTVTREVNVIQQQQQTNVEISLKENRNFMNTLNQYASNEVFEPTPEMPEIDDSQVVSRNVQQPSEVTEVKPLLTSTVKGRNRSIGPAMDAPPEMISLSIPPPVVNSTTTTTTTTTNNVQMTIPPPVQGLVIPPPQQKPPMTIPPPVVPQMRISQPPPFLQANQPPSPAPQPTPPPVSKPPKIATNQIIIVPPVVKQPEPAKPPEQPHPEPQFKTTITTNVYEVKQDTKQVEEKSQVQPGPQPPKLEAKPYVQVQPQPWPAPPPKPAGPGIQVGVGAPSPTPISIPPPPGVVTSQQYIPSSKDVNLPKSPARAPMPKKHIPKFPSSAGSLNLLQIPGAGHANVQPTKRSVKLTDGSVVQIEEPHKLTLPTNESIPRPQPFDDIDIDDISALSKNAVSAETPKLATIEPVNNSASFYESNDLPFALLKPSSGIKIGNMSHPLQQRRIVPPPTIRILGVPSEW
ncbi:hypothetical protein TRFO_24383 [Tritrichomonas foetus]|uniref:Uncharacterized protein n=1 Tax=Tritrichomonas foetus TaxID=1144522 RepID=A0A1J4K957_9EUKA|nr:hypothetical protein TRFO_24383 [Tritrichomonas foetus]|eukprot:OHT07424.1 hypothetical protein TRFO_24383 [Tritrichomonas foetus]